jgi:hypothetical protein
MELHWKNICKIFLNEIGKIFAIVALFAESQNTIRYKKSEGAHYKEKYNKLHIYTKIVASNRQSKVVCATFFASREYSIFAVEF